MNKIDEIKNIMSKNNGYITTEEANNSNIHRMYLKIMHDNGLIERVGNGIYIDTNIMEDSYYILSLELPRVIYSHMTALYFHGLSIKAPNEEYDITVPKNYYNYKLKKHNVFYVKKDIYELGLMGIKTPMGNIVKVYDMERCICDIIRSRNRLDMEHIKYSIKEYLKRKDKNLVKLSEYADKFGIKEEVMDFVSIMY